MIRGLIFDLNGTVIDICTNEYYDDIWRVISNFLDYQGIALSREDLGRLYFEINKKQRRSSCEEFPEFDVVALFQEIVDAYATDTTRALPPEKREQLPGILAEVFRAASRFRLQLYPDVPEVLDVLRKKYLLAAVSDGQSVWAVPELRSVGLEEYFSPVIVSGDLGYRKPDARIFETALAEMNLSPAEVLFVGNDMYRDVFGAHRLGIKTVFFKSNQGEQKEAGAAPDYIIYNFRELLDAVHFLEKQNMDTVTPFY